MTKPDWTTAPHDAEFYGCGAFRKHDSGNEYRWKDGVWRKAQYDTIEHYETHFDDFDLRPSNHPAPPAEWPASDDRIDTIGQNGGDGEHYSSEPEWVEWSAKFDGDCPVPEGHDVEVRFLDGETERNDIPEEWNWYNSPHIEMSADIVAYRDWTAFNLKKMVENATMMQQAQMSGLYPQYYKDCRHLDSIDVYGVHDLFGIQDASGCLQHASKKILLSGKRNGGKDLYQDIKEARDTLTRKLQLMEAGK